MDALHFMTALGLASSIGLVLGMLGGGGSMLAVPLLIYVAGFTPAAAVGAALGIVALAAMSASLPYARQRNVDWRTAALFAPGGMAGAFAGGWSAQFVPASVLMALLGAGMLVAAAAMWRVPQELVTGRRQVRRGTIIAAGVLVGAITGLTGLGGGFLIVPALTLAAGLTMRRAVGTSLVLVAAQALAGLGGHMGHLDIQLPTSAALGIGAVLGAFAGARLASLVNIRNTRRGFAFLLVAAALMTINGLGWGWPAPAAAALLAMAITTGYLIRRIGLRRRLGPGSQASPADSLTGFVLDYQI